MAICLDMANEAKSFFKYIWRIMEVGGSEAFLMVAWKIHPEVAEVIGQGMCVPGGLRLHMTSGQIPSPKKA